MRVIQQTLEAAAAAALATSFFAFPIGLAGMHTVPNLSARPETPVRVATFLPSPPDAAKPEGPEGTDGSEPPGGPGSDADTPATEPAITPPGPPSTAPSPSPGSPEAAAPLRVPALARKHSGTLHPSILIAREASESRTKPKRTGRRDRCAETDPRIEARGDDNWRIERDLVDAYTGDLDEAANLAWVGWHRNADGDISGFRVKRIRCGSVLHQAGFRNGDIITAVNGRPVTTITQALSAYRKLRRKRTLDVDNERRGQKRRLRYRLT